MAVSFNVTSTDTGLIVAIARRAVRIGIVDRINVLGVQLHLAACHANGNPLRLDDLLQGEDIHFVHDITGILEHLDTDTGQLRDGWTPRYSAAQTGSGA